MAMSITPGYAGQFRGYDMRRDMACSGRGKAVWTAQFLRTLVEDVLIME